MISFLFILILLLFRVLLLAFVWTCCLLALVYRLFAGFAVCDVRLFTFDWCFGCFDGLLWLLVILLWF